MTSLFKPEEKAQTAEISTLSLSLWTVVSLLWLSIAIGDLLRHRTSLLTFTHAVLAAAYLAVLTMNLVRWNRRRKAL